MLDAFGISRAILPDCVGTSRDYGTLSIGEQRIPLRVCTGDQSAAAYAYGRPVETAALVNVGTGAFMITDFVPGSVATLKRNPNYWDKDPIGPGKGNALPYIDELRYLIIPDASTREAAMRTGKIDQWGLTGDQWETVNTLKKNVPALLAGLAFIDRFDVDRSEHLSLFIDHHEIAPTAVRLNFLSIEN